MPDGEGEIGRFIHEALPPIRRATGHDINFPVNFRVIRQGSFTRAWQRDVAEDYGINTSRRQSFVEHMCDQALVALGDSNHGAVYDPVRDELLVNGLVPDLMLRMFTNFTCAEDEIVTRNGSAIVSALVRKAQRDTYPDFFQYQRECITSPSNGIDGISSRREKYLLLETFSQYDQKKALENLEPLLTQRAAIRLFPETPPVVTFMIGALAMLPISPYDMEAKERLSGWQQKDPNRSERMVVFKNPRLIEMFYRSNVPPSEALASINRR